MSFAPGSEPVDLIWPNPVEGAFPRLVEAAWVIRHEDFIISSIRATIAADPTPNMA